MNSIGFYAELILNRLSTERQLREQQIDNEVDEPEKPAEADEHDDQPRAGGQLMQGRDKKLMTEIVRVSRAAMVARRGELGCHGIPQRLFGAVRPRASSAGFKIV